MNISFIIRLFTGGISIITENRCSGIIGYQNFRTFHRIWQVIDGAHKTLHVRILLCVPAVCIWCSVNTFIIDVILLLPFSYAYTNTEGPVVAKLILMAVFTLQNELFTYVSINSQHSRNIFK